MANETRFPMPSGWQLLLVDIGVDPIGILVAAGLPKDLFMQEQASVTKTEYFAFFNALDQLPDSDTLALKFAQSFSTESFSPPIFAALCSANFNIALQRLQLFKPLIAPLKLDLRIDQKTTHITIGYLDEQDYLPTSAVMLELVFFTQLLRTATRTKLGPQAVFCPQQPVCSDQYAAYFGVALQRADTPALVFSAESANQPFLTENHDMWTFFEPELRSRLSQLTQKMTTGQRVKNALLELIPSGQVSADHVASELAMSKCTLQRKLKQENTFYQAILDATRMELAKHYLTQSRIGYLEMSLLLGFSESTSFYRAFAQWTGSTPEAYRHQFG